MSEVWYRTNLWGERITGVEVDRHTDSSVWIKGRRFARNSEYRSFFPTWQEAKACLLDGADRKLQSARLALQRAQGEHGNISGLKEPTDA